MGQQFSYKGGTQVRTEPGQHVATRDVMGALLTPGGQALQVKRAFVNAGAGGDSDLVPAVADAVIRIIGIVMLAGATATDVTFKSVDSEAAATAISPLFANSANGGAIFPLNEQGWLQGLDVNCKIAVTCGAGSAVGVLVQYVEIPADAFGLL